MPGENRALNSPPNQCGHGVLGCVLGFQPRRVSSILTARTKSDLRLAAQDARLSSEVTRVQIPQVGPFPPSSNGRMPHFECEDRGSNP